MRKKHFIALADHLRWEFAKHPNFNQIVESLADFCDAQSSSFNRQRWLDYIHGRCGPNGGRIEGGTNK